MRSANLRRDDGTKIPDWAVGAAIGGGIGLVSSAATFKPSVDIDEQANMVYRVALSTLFVGTLGLGVGAVIGYLRT